MIGVFVFIFFATDSTKLCVENYLFMFAFNLHACWVCYMSYLMRKVIYLKQDQDRKSVKFVYLLLVTLSAGISAIIFSNIRKDLCILYYDLPTLCFLLGTFILPHSVIFIVVIVCYMRIREALIVEIYICEVIAKLQRRLFTRIYGYPLIFLLISVVSALALVEGNIPATRQPLMLIRFIILSYYPFFNSLLYGLTKSSVRVLKYCINKDFDYISEEIILNDLREDDYILPGLFGFT